MIVAMKKLELIGLTKDRDKLLADLMRLSCAQIEDQTALLTDEGYAGLLSRAEADTANIKAATNSLKQSLDTLIKYAHPKKGLFAQRPVLSEKELMDGKSLETANTVGEAILSAGREIAALNTEEGRLQNQRAALVPWENYEGNLAVESTEHVVIQLGICPATSNIAELQSLLPQNAPLSELQVIHSDREQHYLLFLCHISQETEALALLKSYSFSRMQFKDVTTTAFVAIAACDKRLEILNRKREQAVRGICSHVGEQHILESAIDALGVYLARGEAAERTLATQTCFQITAWLEAPRQEAFERAIAKYDCAWSLSEPVKEEARPPIKFKNSKLIEPFNMVTDMYALPDYYNVDPNPLFSIWFALFFAIMYADVGYGLVLIGLGLFVNHKTKLRGVMGQMFRLMPILGVFVVAIGWIFGGFFSDFLSVLGGTFFDSPHWGIPANLTWFNPMDDPLKMLIFCLILGGLQIIFGMCIKAYLLIKDGRPLDALMDVGSWWLLFAGIAVMATGGPSWVVIAGALALVCTQGRHAKGIAGKLVGGIASLYDITAYLSDILSYSRLMALCMAGAVIGSVFNMLAGMLGGIGPKVVGFVLFFVMFIVGHVFNMAINIIGTYVHAARLQYLEFFGKFYEEGGKRFTPLTINTKYVDIIKEEH